MKSNIMFPRNLYGWTPVGQFELDDIKIAVNIGMLNECEMTFAYGKHSSSSIMMNTDELYELAKLLNQTVNVMRKKNSDPVNKAKVVYYNP